jgi:hypothetical protein
LTVIFVVPTALPSILRLPLSIFAEAIRLFEEPALTSPLALDTLAVTDLPTSMLRVAGVTVRDFAASSATTAPMNMSSGKKSHRRLIELGMSSS